MVGLGDGALGRGLRAPQLYVAPNFSPVSKYFLCGKLLIPLVETEMEVECRRCGCLFETSGITVKMCSECSAQYRRERGYTKPLGWVRKTSDMVEYRRQHRLANPEKYREYEKRRPPKTNEQERKKYENRMKRLRGADYVVGDPKNKTGGRSAVLTDEERRERHNTRRKTRRAIASGLLIPTPCQVCGCENVEAHHVDYSDHMNVVWLCSKHHRDTHHGKMCESVVEVE